MLVGGGGGWMVFDSVTFFYFAVSRFLTLILILLCFNYVTSIHNRPAGDAPSLFLGCDAAD